MRVTWDDDLPYAVVVPPRPPVAPPPSRWRVAAAKVPLVPLLVVALGVVGVLGGARAAGLGARTYPEAPRAAAAPLGAPGVPPAGEGGYAFLDVVDGQPTAYDRCAPLHYVVRPDGAPEDWQELLDTAMGHLSAATGLQVVDDGTTDEDPDDERALVQPDRYGDGVVPVLIAFSDEDESPDLAGDVVGYAGSVPGDPDGRGLRWLTGTVVLESAALQAYDAYGRPADAEALALVLHELGHLVGLDHVDDPGDTMAAEGLLDGDGYTAGALRGLAALGAVPCPGGG